MSEREQNMRNQIEALCNLGLKACAEKDLKRSLQIMRMAGPVLAELAKETGDTGWEGHADVIGSLVTATDAFLDGKERGEEAASDPRIPELEKLLLNLCEIGQKKCDEEEPSLEGLKEILKVGHELKQVLLELISLGKINYLPWLVDTNRRIQRTEAFIATRH